MFKFTISFIIIDFPLCIVIFFVFSFVFFYDLFGVYGL